MPGLQLAQALERRLEVLGRGPHLDVAGEERDVRVVHRPAQRLEVALAPGLVEGLDGGDGGLFRLGPPATVRHAASVCRDRPCAPRS